MSEDKSIEYAKTKTKELCSGELGMLAKSDWTVLVKPQMETALAAAFRAGAAWGAMEATKRERIVVPQDHFDRELYQKPGTITHLEAGEKQ